MRTEFKDVSTNLDDDSKDIKKMIEGKRDPNWENKND